MLEWELRKTKAERKWRDGHSGLAREDGFAA
jgi:hypothetical protein